MMRQRRNTKTLICIDSFLHYYFFSCIHLEWQFKVDLEALALGNLNNFGHFDDHTCGLVE